MKKLFLLISAFLVFVFPVFAQIDDSQAGEHIQSFDSNITITKEGKINVRETVVYDFSGLQKHGIFREIPYITTNQDNKKYEFKFEKFSVTDENSKSYNFTTSYVSEKNIRLKIGDADKLITGIHTYVISYEVSGALGYFSDHDELYWNVTGNEWNVPIANTTASVIFPQEIKKEDIKTTCYTGVHGSNVADCSYLINDRVQDNIKAERTLSSNEGLTIVVGFPKNIVAVLEPKEFVSFWNTFVGKIVSFLFGLAALIWYVILPFYIIYRWLKFGRDPSSAKASEGQAFVGKVTAWFDPPKTQDGKRFLTPGEVGTLGDETVDMKDISATIVDLARRGYLIIDERKKGDFYLVRRSPKSGGGFNSLLTYEKTILTGFFGSKKEIRIKDQELSSEVAQITNEMYKQVIEDKLFDKNPQSTRTIYYVIAGIALFTANFFLAIVAFLFGRVMPRKTIFGVEAKNVSFSLKNFLSSQQRQLEFQADKQMMFERLLPFAVAFGVERIWAKRFETLNITQPTWYQSYSTSNFNSMLLISSLNSSFRSVSSVATPTRSSTGHSSGFSGGFSGGGGGGGGGGSW